MKCLLKIFVVFVFSCLCVGAVHSQTERDFTTLYKKLADIKIICPADKTRIEKLLLPQKKKSQLQAIDDLSDDQFDDYIKNSMQKFREECIQSVKNDTLAKYDFLALYKEPKEDCYVEKTRKAIETLESTPLTGDFKWDTIIPEDTKVILVGEIHNIGVENVVVQIIRDLKAKKKISYFASEFMDTNMENTLKKFYETGDENYIRSYDGLLDQRNRYLQNQRTVKAAAGLKIIPLENIRYEYLGIDTEEQLSKTIFTSKLTRAIKYRWDDTKDFMISPVGMASRNIFWMKRLVPYLQQDGVILVYAGGAHTRYGDVTGSISDRLKAAKINTLVINFEGSAVEVGKWGSLIKVPEDKKQAAGADYIVLYPIGAFCDMNS
ncbi:MAG: hypothetical protein FWF35_03655 [Elusimicrobia bacterium]|nr:hypothetical protein [Elusimicrobiota bacterium]